MKRLDPAYLGKPASPGCERRHHGAASTGPDVAELVAGPDAARARAALARGVAVVWQPCLLRDGTVAVVHGDRTTRVPAVALGSIPGAYDTLPAAVLPASTVRGLGLTPVDSMLVIATSRVPTEAEEDRARAAFGQQNADLVVERGYQSEYLPGFLALIGGAGLVTLAGVAISVSLSAAEGRADLATLAAVGGRRAAGVGWRWCRPHWSPASAPGWGSRSAPRSGSRS